jgi:hypothetical protein
VHAISCALLILNQHWTLWNGKLHKLGAGVNASFYWFDGIYYYVIPGYYFAYRGFASEAVQILLFVMKRWMAAVPTMATREQGG